MWETPQTKPAVRALGAVLGSLANLGRDARWCVLRASDIGAPHRRERIFLASWRRDAAAENTDQLPGFQRGSQHPAKRRDGGHGPNLADEIEWLLPHQRPGSGARAPSATGQQRLPLSAITGPEPVPRLFDSPPTHRGSPGPGGHYSAAIARWERLTRPAPAPTDHAGRLSPRFVEWMQGRLDDGWVTATTGLSRPAQLAALGNGIVPQQATEALRLLAPPLPGCPHRTHG